MAAAHPDRHPEAVEAATRRLQLLNEARDVLCDPVRRRIYEATWLKDEPVTTTEKAAGQVPRAEWERKRYCVRDRDFSYLPPYGEKTRVVQRRARFRRAARGGSGFRAG